MSKFYVGQRVRVIWSDGWPELAGKTGTIESPSPNGGVCGVSEWRVAPDCWGTCSAPRRGIHGARFFVPNSSQLEHLTDPGREVVSWETCEWKPPHLREVTA